MYILLKSNSNFLNTIEQIEFKNEINLRQKKQGTTRSQENPSIVGMLLYLSTNTRRIDISFAVSQVTRFNHSPKKSHATAVKTIVRYLHQTSYKGTIITPSGDLSLDCYVDADFAGLFGRDPDREPSSVLCFEHQHARSPAIACPSQGSYQGSPFAI